MTVTPEAPTETVGDAMEIAWKDAEALRRRMEIARRYSFIHRPRS